MSSSSVWEALRAAKTRQSAPLKPRAAENAASTQAASLHRRAVEAVEAALWDAAKIRCFDGAKVLAQATEKQKRKASVDEYVKAVTSHGKGVRKDHLAAIAKQQKKAAQYMALAKKSHADAVASAFKMKQLRDALR